MKFSNSQSEIYAILTANSHTTFEMHSDDSVTFNAYDSGIEVTVSPDGEILDSDPWGSEIGLQ